MAQADKDSDQDSSMTLFETFKSVLWAILGVQSKENLQRDFARGKAKHFIIIGIAFVVLFVLTLIVIVKTVLSFTG